MYVAMLHYIKKEEEEEEEKELKLTLILKEFKDYTNVLNEKGVALLLEYSKRVKHAIKIKKGKQPL
jgi:hypothetical protein